jgi:hypothetical protein
VRIAQILRRQTAAPQDDKRLEQLTVDARLRYEKKTPRLLTGAVAGLAAI